jgi:hypothetical protein
MDSFYPSIKEVFGASFKISCVMWASDLTEEDYRKRSADLRLIAAAPDLLEAVWEFLEMTEEPPEPNCSCHIAPPCGDCVDHEGLRGAFKVARAAIAKATGEQA